MQRTLSRRRGAVAREEESDSDEERADGEQQAAGERGAAARVVADAAGAVAAALAPSGEATPALALPPRFASSGAQLKLHTFDARATPAGYVETKIGGHELDHKRPFYEDWHRQLGGPIKTAVVGAVSALGSALSGAKWTASARSSPAYDARKSDVLVYSSVKIAGHPMDHVPFINRGQPSRPLWGYVPNLNWPTADSKPALPGPGPQVARMYQIEPNVLSNLYDCSRCLRLRQSPRVQLCCGHGVCASCVSSRTIKHVEHDRTCFLECVRCNDLVAVESVVFTNHVVRLQEPLARTVSELSEMAQSSQSVSADSKQSSFSRLGLAWKHGGVIAALSFLAGRLYPSGKTSRSSVKNWHGVRSPNKPATLRDVEALAAPIPESVTRLLLDDVADLSKHLAPSTIDIIAKGPDRWAKRVQGLKPPSKLLKFDFVRTLGVGNFAEVMLVRNRKGAYSVLKESDKLSEAVNEISILSRINNPNVVRIFQYFIEEVGHRHFAYIEMEYCDGGDLMQMLRDQGPLVESKFNEIFSQLCAGLKEIHDRGIIHRDLKPGNVLMMSDGVAKIADFGVSTCLESDLLTHHAAGTLAYMAPEVRRYFLGEDVSYDVKADVWSLGALAVAMLTGNPEPRVATRPLEEVIDELRERDISESSLALVERLLQRQPGKRPALDELLASTAFTKARL